MLPIPSCRPLICAILAYQNVYHCVWFLNTNIPIRTALSKEVMSRVNPQICRKPLRAHRGRCLRDALISCPSESSNEKDPLSQQLILDLVLSFSFNAGQGFKSNWSILLALFFLPPNITCCQEKQPLIALFNLW